MSKEERAWDNLCHYHPMKAQKVEQYSGYDQSAVLAIMTEFIENYPYGIRACVSKAKDSRAKMLNQHDMVTFTRWFENYKTLVKN